MAVTGPLQARAVALFDPLAGAPGFLQPILMGVDGDNQSYVQLFTDPGRVDDFMAIGWPDRDFSMIADKPLVARDGEPLWAFRFPGEEPFALPWSLFRTTMRARLDDPSLGELPLLKFDIVDTLDLEDAKRGIYAQAYRAYAAMDAKAADNWRDRAILEPALAALLPRSAAGRDDAGSMLPVTGDRHGQMPRLMARMRGERLVVSLEGLGTDPTSRVRQAYQQLAERYPEIFPSAATIIAEPASRRTTLAPRKQAAITVVLVGRIRHGLIAHEEWQRIGVEVVDTDHFHPQLRIGRESLLTVILGAQSEWPLMVDAGLRMGGRPAVIVSLSTSVAPLVRDLEFQERTDLPTIAFFAPFATSIVRGRDPVQPARPLIEIFRQELADQAEGSVGISFRAKSSMLVREPLWADQDHLESGCRLAARALRAGAVPGGKGRLYTQGNVADRDHAEWEFELRDMFDMYMPGERIRLDGRRGTLLLLIERVSRYDPDELNHHLQLGVRKLLEMRGWQIVDDRDGHFSVTDGERKFGVAIVEHRNDLPTEDAHWPTPGLDRAPLLVVHTQSRREQLLIGNRGSFLHIALEDIALMKPGSQWVWAVVRRQLFDNNGKPSLASLRMVAALVVEAIRRGNVQPSIMEPDWAEVETLLAGSDCERFVDFLDGVPKRHRASVLLRLSGVSAKHQSTGVLIELRLDDNGPVVTSLG